MMRIARAVGGPGRWIGLLLGAALTCSALAGAQPTAPPPAKTAGQPSLDPAELKAFVDGLAQEALTGDHVAGVSIAIVQHGKTVLLRGYGMARQSPYAPVDPQHTLFRLGSLSKTFTWIAVMRAVEAGRLRLEAPVDNYLPAPLKTADGRFARPITLADLMDHAAGYENRDIGRLFATEKGLRPLEAYLAANRPARVRPPGEFATYSNYGASLAGVAAARASNLPFEALIDRDIIGPLGLRDTTFREPYAPRSGLPTPMDPSLAARLADGFVWGGGRFLKQPFEHILTPPAGSASSTAADMARYMLAQLGGGHLDGVSLYGPATAAALRTPLLARPVGVNGWAHGYQMIALPGGHLAYGHGGATQFFFSNLLLVPDLDLGIFVAVNSRTGDPFVKRFPREIVEHFYAGPAAQLPPPGQALVGERGRYEGSYLATRRAYSGLQEALAHLTSIASVKVTRDGYLATQAGSPQLWRAAGGPGLFKSTDGEDRILFQFGADGRALRWLNASGTTAYERVGFFQTPGAFLLLATLVLVTSVLALGAVLLRPRTGAPANTRQAAARAAVAAIAAAWLASFVALGLWLPAVAAGGEAGWPGPALLFASSAALAASLGSLVLAAFTPWALAVPSTAKGTWTRAAKLRHIWTVAISLAFAALLFSWGALAPWNS